MAVSVCLPGEQIFNARLKGLREFHCGPAIHFFIRRASVWNQVGGQDF
jgi:hypothetical protein